MKPLSIEELKNLIIGTWVYLTDKDGYLGRYVVKAEAPIEEDDKTFNFDSLSGTWTYNYRYYGTKWLAYKNKEQAECKGEWIELPRIIHPNELEWFVQYQYPSGVIDYEIFYSLEKAEQKLKELRNIDG